MTTINKHFTTDNAVYDCVIAHEGEILSSVTATIVKQNCEFDEYDMPIYTANAIGRITYNGEISTRGLGASTENAVYIQDFLEIVEKLKTI